MLDLSDPQSKHIFAAAKLEDEIRSRLLAWRNANAGECLSAPREIQDVYLPALRELNRKHFGSSPGIERTLADLSAAVAAGDHTKSWQVFLSLAETSGDNFGTWAI